MKLASGGGHGGLAALQRRLRPLYFTAFLQGFVLWYAIEKLFMTSIGIDYQGIAVLTVLYVAVMMVANLPLGILADRWSRKRVLALASVFLAGGSLVDGLSHGFTMYLIGTCLWGLFYACYSGIYDSVVYDCLVEETGSADRFEHYYGRIQAVDSIALVASSLLSAAVVHFLSVRAAYFLTLPFSVVSLCTLWLFREPQLHKSSEPALLSAHIRDTLRAVLRRRAAMWLVVSLILLTLLGRLILEFDQLWLIALALPLWLFGPVNAVLLGMLGAGGVVAKHVKHRPAAVIGTGVGIAIVSLCLLARLLGLAVPALVLLILGWCILQITVSRWLHDTLPSRLRAGGSSAVATLGYGVFIPVGLLFGHISNAVDIFHAGWIVIVTCVLIAGTVLLALKGRRAAPATTTAVQHSA